VRAVIGFLAAAVLCATGCSGGGGGGESGSGLTKSASTGVRVLHGAIDAPPMDLVASSDATPLDTARFGRSAFYAGLGTGDQTITLTKAHTPGEVFANLPISLGKNERRSIVLYGNRETFGLRTNVLEDSPGEPAAGNALVRIVHALVGAGTLGSVAGATTVGSGISFGGASDYVEVPAGVLNLSAQRETDGLIVFSGAKTLEAGGAYTFLITGEVGALVIATQYDDR
jgi:hypothetical protein